ncbi:MAG: tyrosine protein kinase [Tannerella sp.]|jgi:tRNA A-37 threonylcarbamoyl transferase component Bud32|nr:tyrosine protein kinase [Tannerella sp.]
MKIILNPEEKSFEAFIRSIPEVFEQAGKTIHKGRNEIKVFNVNGTSLNVKRFKVPHFINRIAYTFFRPTKTERSYRYALVLREKGINTPEPVACILIKKNGLIHDSYFISRQVDHRHTMYEFGKGGISGREHIIKAFAAFTADLHEKGVYHKDYSPGNILFDGHNEQVDFCLVDINRMQFGAVTVAKGCANFARLWGQEDMFLLLAEAYAAVRNASAAECRRRILYSRNKFWKHDVEKQQVPFDFN